MTDKEKLAKILESDRVVVSSDVYAALTRLKSDGEARLDGIQISECRWLPPCSIMGVEEIGIPVLDVQITGFARMGGLP